VDDPRAVRGAESVPELREDLLHLDRGQRAAAPEDDAEVFAFEELHRQVRDRGRFVDAGGDDLDDVITLEARTDPRFLDESLSQRGIGDELRVHELERAPLARAPLLGDVDGAHAPFGEG
jgi:hypothetical protein